MQHCGSTPVDMVDHPAGEVGPEGQAWWLVCGVTVICDQVRSGQQQGQRSIYVRNAHSSHSPNSPYFCIAKDPHQTPTLTHTHTHTLTPLTDTRTDTRTDTQTQAHTTHTTHHTHTHTTHHTNAHHRHTNTPQVTRSTFSK